MPMSHEDFFSTYFKYVENTESPYVFHRWSILTVLAAHMGANIVTPMGHFNIRAHFYIQLLGVSGSRKSSAIRIARKLASKLGLVNISPKQISREALISLLQELTDKAMGELEDFEAMFEGIEPDIFTNLLIPADEFNAFVGERKDAYMLLLSQLWDGDTDFSKRLQSGSEKIERPYINVMSANTFTGFADAFNGSALGMGMLTRMIVVPWAKKRRRLAFPPPPDLEAEAAICSILEEAYAMEGIVSYAEGAKDILSDIYKDWKMSTPESMQQYEERRFIHLLKICTIFACIEGELIITPQIVLNANTMLASNEQRMANAFTFVFAPQGQGEVMNFIHDYLQANRAGASMGKLAGLTANMCSTQVLLIALNRLVASRRILYSRDADLYLYMPDMLGADMRKFLNLDFLCDTERAEFGVAVK